MQEIAFRLDSSFALGSGHLIRCMSLALHLRQNGVNCFFICKKLAGNQSNKLKEMNFPVYEIDESLSIIEDASKTLEIIKKIGSCRKIIVDHYQLSTEFETFFKNNHFFVISIDDLGDRKHNCDIIIDQNFRTSYDQLYINAPSYCAKLLGPNYSLLRPDFMSQIHQERPRAVQIKKVLVFFGSGDLNGETLRFAQQIPTNSSLEYNIIVSSSNRHIGELKSLKPHSQIIFHFDPQNIPELMRHNDIYFGASGSITWERFCLKLGGFTVTVADNQIDLARSLASQSLTWNLGPSNQIDFSNIEQKFKHVESKQLEEYNQQIKSIALLMQSHNLKKVISLIIQ